MRQLGDHQFQHDPGRHDPAQQEFRALLAARRPDARDRHGGQRRARPERHPEQREIVSRRRAMRLLRAHHLAHQILPDRFGKETRAGTADDGEEPGQHQNAEPDQAGNRPQRRKPAHRAIEHSQGHDREPDEQHDQRPLEQDTGGERGPEDRGQRPAGQAGRRPALAEVDARHRAHRGDGGQEQHRIGLGEAGLDAQQDRRRHHQSGQQRGAPRDEGERGPVGQQHRADRADQRGNPIEPDFLARVPHAHRFGGFHHGRLQPIDADRLLVANLVLEADVDVLAGFQHLLGRLGEARLVAIRRAGSERTPAGRRAAPPAPARRPRAHATPSRHRRSRSSERSPAAVLVAVVVIPLSRKSGRTIEKSPGAG